MFLGLLLLPGEIAVVVTGNHNLLFRWEGVNVQATDTGNPFSGVNSVWIWARVLWYRWAACWNLLDREVVTEMFTFGASISNEVNLGIACDF